jgi:hypothetical protein
MALFLEQKWPRLILAAYLACAIIGIFTFVATEPLRSADFLADAPFSGGSFTQVELPIDCLAEGQTIMSKARGHSFSPLRAGFLRFVVSGVQNSGAVLAQPSLKVIEEVNSLTIKKSIPLKLRI